MLLMCILPIGISFGLRHCTETKTFLQTSQFVPCQWSLTNAWPHSSFCHHRSFLTHGSPFFSYFLAQNWVNYCLKTWSPGVFSISITPFLSLPWPVLDCLPSKLSSASRWKSRIPWKRRGSVQRSSRCWGRRFLSPPSRSGGSHSQTGSPHRARNSEVTAWGENVSGHYNRSIIKERSFSARYASLLEMKKWDCHSHIRTSSSFTSHFQTRSSLVMNRHIPDLVFVVYTWFYSVPHCIRSFTESNDEYCYMLLLDWTDSRLSTSSKYSYKQTCVVICWWGYEIKLTLT